MGGQSLEIGRKAENMANIVINNLASRLRFSAEHFDNRFLV